MAEKVTDVRWCRSLSSVYLFVVPAAHVFCSGMVEELATFCEESSIFRARVRVSEGFTK